MKPNESERIVRELQAHGWGCKTVSIPDICAVILALKSENDYLKGRDRENSETAKAMAEGDWDNAF
jgi:hypothetical protein